MTVDVTEAAVANWTLDSQVPELVGGGPAELASVEGAREQAPGDEQFAISPVNGARVLANADTAARARAAKRAKRLAEAERAVASVGDWEAVVAAVTEKAISKGSPAAMMAVGKAIDAFPREDRERHSSSGPATVVVQVQAVVNARVLHLVDGDSGEKQGEE